ncbi:hypothetical protein RKE29_21255 [Streptomyces sp. B1866]|uniref:DUF6801 domain-containing protein n=1 Tax=Streptomyces sp. B1866 TaxID=3075431 RepID=UPI00288F613A|nr:DUF6801 domain-containing protein [Streptomyces sp. B1866]MDT3399142.1 hypothetical protein [Streptomyces sp. B1866]
MRSKVTPRRARYAALAAVTVAAAGGVAGVVGTGTASADPVSLTLNYTCNFPQIGEEQIKIKISSDIPTWIPVNTSTPKFKISSVTTVNDETTAGLGLVGAKSLEGEAKASATVDVPQGKVPVKPKFVIEKTAVPESGSFDVKADGSAPQLRFSKPGPGSIVVGDIDLVLTVRNGAGTVIDLDDDGGTFTAPCKQNPGQKNALAKFTITTGTVPPSIEPTTEEPSTDPTTSEPSTSPPQTTPSGTPSDPPSGTPSDGPSADPSDAPSETPSAVPTDDGSAGGDPGGDPGGTSGGTSGGGAVGGNGWDGGSGTSGGTQLGGGTPVDYGSGGSLAATGSGSTSELLFMSGAAVAAGSLLFGYLPRRLRRRAGESA